VIAGRIPPTKGEIWFKGENITHLPTYVITKKGLGRSYQITNIFPKLTVFENIRLAAQAIEVTYNFWENVMFMDSINRKVMEILEKLKLIDQKDIRAANLPHGLQRHLEIGIALASQPELLLLDEPTAGMTNEETERMMELIDEISKGLTIVLVEHDMKFVMSVSKKITVLHEGRILSEGTPEEIQKSEEVQRIYLGKQK
jgi:branched-chain amino acid transport system ATP-binding protein